MPHLLLSVLLGVGLACDGDTLGPLPSRGRRVLFIGNSLTFVNDLSRTIAADGWELMVMQQGPSSLIANQEFLRVWTVKLDSAVRAAGARGAPFPAPLGAYLVALVHFEMRYDRPATELPDVAYVGGKRLDVPAATVTLLPQAAHETVRAWGVR